MRTPEQIRSTLKTRLVALGVSQAEFCDIAIVSDAKLSRFINGARGTHIRDLQRIEHTLAGLERLAAKCTPIPINFADYMAIRRLLDQEYQIVWLVSGADNPRFRFEGGVAVLAGWAPAAVVV